MRIVNTARDEIRDMGYISPETLDLMSATEIVEAHNLFNLSQEQEDAE